MNWKDEVAKHVAAALSVGEGESDIDDHVVAARAYDLADALAAESCRRYEHDLGSEGRFSYCDRCGESRQECVLPPEDPT